MALPVVGAVLVAGPLAGFSLSSRVRFARDPRSFRCRLGRAPGRWRAGARWRRGRAMWVSDVLLVQTGALRLSAVPLAVRIAAEDELQVLTPDDVPGLGRHPLSLRMLRDGGPAVEIAAAEADRGHLVGPFLAAAMPGLPRAPRERGG